MNKALVTLSLSVLFVACSGVDRSSAETSAIPVEKISPTSDQQARRTWSEGYCKEHGIPVYENPEALFTDPEASVNIRSKDEVVDRVYALLYIGVKSEGAEPEILKKIDQEYNVSSKFSPEEKAYATAINPTEQQKINANWRYEGLHVMLWALGYIDSLDYPDKLCNVADDVKLIRDAKKTLREKARLRSKAEILQQADLILRLNWACVEARVDKKEVPGHLDPGVVVERHHALNWLINYMNQNWDDVETHT